MSLLSVILIAYFTPSVVIGLVLAYDAWKGNGR